MSAAFKCDRCGEFQPGRSALLVRVDSYPETQRGMELCERCAGEFRSWARGHFSAAIPALETAVPQPSTTIGNAMNWQRQAQRILDPDGAAVPDVAFHTPVRGSLFGEAADPTFLAEHEEGR